MSDDERHSGDEVDEAAEAERRRQEEEAEEARRKKEAQAKMRAAQQKKKGSKRKGLCLSPEKRKLLKQLIMEKAAEEMRAEAKKRAEEKERHIQAAVPSLSIDGMDKAALVRKVQELYKLYKDKEADKYDSEFKVQKQDLEINDLTSKVNDIKGKFVKPVLKKVTKTDKIKKVEKAGIGDVRSSLKSTGQSKYQLDDQPAEPKTPDWRGTLSKKEGEGDEPQVNGDAAPEEVEAEA